MLRKRSTLDAQESKFVETPRGIFTASGIWFRTSEEALESFAGPVLEKESLVELIDQSEVWLRSPQTLSLWVMPLLLLILPAWAAILTGLAVFVGWSLLAPSLGSAGLGRLFKQMEHVILQVGLYVAVLGWLASWPDFAKVFAGLVWFIALRWKLIDLVTKPILQPIRSRWYPLPPADQMLRAVIVSSALRHRISLPELDRMEERMLNAFNK